MAAWMLMAVLAQAAADLPVQAAQAATPMPPASDADEAGLILPAEGYPQNPSQADAQAIEILWPVPYYARAGKEMTPNSRRLEQLLKQVGVPHRFAFTPIKRAFHLYTATKAGCMPHGTESLLAGELISQSFASTAQWFYVRAEDGIHSASEIRTAAALEGIKRFFEPKGYGWISWQYAPAYPALVAMLKNGRVQAVALGPGVADGTMELPDGVVRLEAKPFVSLQLHLHCKPTPEAKRLIDRLDAVVLAGGR